MVEHEFQPNGPGIVGSDLCTLCGKESEDHGPHEWLIRKGGYFYRPNCSGYTTSKFEAGRYTKAKAEAEAAVEPWHMKAVHQDDVEDDPVSSRVRMDGERIATLAAENERLMGERDEAREDVAKYWTSADMKPWCDLAEEKGLGHFGKKLKGMFNRAIAAENDARQEYERAEKAEAEVERLTRERDHAKAAWSGCASVLMDTRSDLARTEASAAVKVDALKEIRHLSRLDNALSEGASAEVMSRMADIHQNADAALSPAPQEAEAVAVYHACEECGEEWELLRPIDSGTKLYTHPPAQAVTEAQVDRVLDAAGDYLGVQYGNTALHHPIDRARIKDALTLATSKGGEM